jgi:hypothetical protein
MTRTAPELQCVLAPCEAMWSRWMLVIVAGCGRIGFDRLLSPAEINAL